VVTVLVGVGLAVGIGVAVGLTLGVGVGRGRSASAVAETADEAITSAMSVEVKGELWKGFAGSCFVCRPIDIWIRVFIGSFLSIWVVPFGLVVLPFAIQSRKFGTKFPKRFEMTEFFDPLSPQRCRIRRTMMAGISTTSDDVRVTIVS
jgi:hypothetical protein